VTDAQVDGDTDELRWLGNYVTETLDSNRGYVSIPHLEIEQIEQAYGSVSAWLTQLPAVRALAEHDLELSSWMPSGLQGTWISYEDDVEDDGDLNADDAGYLTDADDGCWDSVWRYQQRTDGIFVACRHGYRGFSMTDEGADQAGLWLVKHTLTHAECSGFITIEPGESDWYTQLPKVNFRYAENQRYHESLHTCDPARHAECACCCPEATCERRARSARRFPTSSRTTLRDILSR
jgi:hypothetical protein